MKGKLADVGIVIQNIRDEDIEQIYDWCQKQEIFHKRFACGNKVKYGWALPATKAAYNLGEYRNKEFDVYKCKHCGFWHIGRKRIK